MLPSYQAYCASLYSCVTVMNLAYNKLLTGVKSALLEGKTQNSEVLYTHEAFECVYTQPTFTV